MNPLAYSELAETEDIHWWFVGRRVILSSFLARMSLPSNARILEVGCGTGGNLSFLQGFGELSAIDAEARAVEIASSRHGLNCRIRMGSCPDSVPFAEEHFDLICLLDVLEHIEDDVATLVALSRRLAKGGRILVTVPAYRWLWSAHDEFLHHKRRYTMTQLRSSVVSAGLKPVRMTYFNTFLFPVAAVTRLTSRLFQRGTVGTAVPTAAVNGLLGAIFSSERFFLKRVDFPFGVSILGVLSAD